MPHRFAVIVVIAALASATTISVTGQEEPLPRVTPRGAVSAPSATEGVSPATHPAAWQNDLLVVLPSDPIRPARAYTLAEAARDNDYATFHALYLKAREQGQDVSAWTSLDEVWTFAVTDRLGGFYGDTMFRRLSRAYPGFASYMESYQIVDGRGHTFYPTSETRAFLLAEAVRGATPAASTSIARQTPKPSTERSAATARRAEPRTSTARTTGVAKPTATRSAAPAKQAAPAPASTTPAAVAVPAPATVAPAPLVQPTTASPTTAEEAPASTTSQPITPVAPAPSAQAEPSTTTAPAQDAQGSATGRGLLLLVIGLAGVGILALMLRTPREEMPTSIIDHSGEAAANGKRPDDKPQATVEPIRKRSPKPGNPPRQTGAAS